MKILLHFIMVTIAYFGALFVIGHSLGKWYGEYVAELVDEANTLENLKN